MLKSLSQPLLSASLSDNFYLLIIYYICQLFTDHLYELFIYASSTYHLSTCLSLFLVL